MTKDIPDNSVAVGNPAKVICDVDTYLAKEKAKMCAENTFVGIGFDPELTSKAAASANKHGEIFVS